MGLLCQPSGKAALIFVRKYICPLPAPSSTMKKYAHMHGLLKIFRPAYQYLSVKLPQMDEYYRKNWAKVAKKQAEYYLKNKEKIAKKKAEKYQNEKESI